MLEHKTKEGVSMPIYSMADSHLINTIKMIVSKLLDAKNRLFRDSNSGLTNLLYKQGMSKKTAQDYLVNSDALLSPYILEALVRGIDVAEYIKTYTEIIERTTSIKTVGYYDIVPTKTVLSFQNNPSVEDHYGQD